MSLEEFFREILELSEPDLLEKLVKTSCIRLVKKGDAIYRSGEKLHYIWFLMSGVTRGFMVSYNGKDITDCIVFRCGASIMPDADMTKPATITMEALEDSYIVGMPMDGLEDYIKYPSAARLYRRMLLYSAEMHRNFKIVTYQYNATQRYEWFLETHPGLIDRISHKHIASLLNMAPETLSKVRKKKMLNSSHMDNIDRGGVPAENISEGCELT